jgi:hypothetical protein
MFRLEECLQVLDLRNTAVVQNPTLTRTWNGCIELNDEQASIENDA